MKPEIAGVFEKASYGFHYDISTSTGIRIMLVRTAMNSAMIQACVRTHARLCFNLQQRFPKNRKGKKSDSVYDCVVGVLSTVMLMLGLMS